MVKVVRMQEVRIRDVRVWKVRISMIPSSMISSNKRSLNNVSYELEKFEYERNLTISCFRTAFTELHELSCSNIFVFHIKNHSFRFVVGKPKTLTLRLNSTKHPFTTHSLKVWSFYNLKTYFSFVQTIWPFCLEWNEEKYARYRIG